METCELNRIQLVQVKSVDSKGCWLDGKNLGPVFLSFSDMTEDLKAGEPVVVFIQADASGQNIASMKLDRYIEVLDPNQVIYQTGQEVPLLICAKTDLGYKAIIQGRHLGLLYDNEVFQSLHYGQHMNGFIRKVREDGKVDLALMKTGHRAAEDIEPRILKMLESHGGFLAINEKTNPDTIYQLFGVSKKKYKMILGGLYKRKLIKIDEDGIRLVKTPNS